MATEGNKSLGLSMLNIPTIGICKRSKDLFYRFKWIQCGTGRESCILIDKDPNENIQIKTSTLIQINDLFGVRHNRLHSIIWHLVSRLPKQFKVDF